MNQAISFPSYDDRARAAAAGGTARQRLGDLPPSLRRDVAAFAESGLPRKKKAVTKWLESRGVYGAVGDLVHAILKHQGDAVAAKVA
jgi:hypothetical protein